MKWLNGSKINIVSIVFFAAIILGGSSIAIANFTFGEALNLGAPINQGPHHSNSGYTEVDPSISQDELTLYFASSRPGGLGDIDLWMMTRATKEDPWGEPVNLGANVNSNLEDSGPRISQDGLSLYFFSRRSGGQGGRDIWMTTRTAIDAPWQAAENLGAKINTTSGEMDPSISADGLTLYFDRGQQRIYKATRSAKYESWETAVVESVNLNAPAYYDCHPYISPDGLSLYFCSDRPGGYGSMDIYVSTRLSLQSPWGEPVNLGDAINTPYGNYDPCISLDGLTLYYQESGFIRVVMRNSLDELFLNPFPLTSNDTGAQLSSDGLTMYFSSDRPGGCGYQDIWMAARNSPEEPWQEPVNLGPAINSNDWDWAPCISSDGLELYFTSEHNCIADDWDLWVSTRAATDANWEPAVNLGDMVNSELPDGNPILSADKLTLIFSSAREGGKGEGDLWMTQRNEVTESWGKPVNLGVTLNTSNNEDSPSLSTDGRLLFFNSISSDSTTWNYIMMSALCSDGQWGTPQNLTQGIDLPSNAGDSSISSDGRTLYFTSDVPEGIGGYDIWKMDILPLADFNYDGIVNLIDLIIFIGRWGTDSDICDIGPMPWGDGIVDEADLDVLMSYWEQEVELLPLDLTAYWRLDETEGDTAYDSAGNSDGSVHGNPLSQPEGGMVDGALEFDGNDDYIKTPFILNPADGAFSIFAWVKGGAPGQVILSQIDSTNLLSANASGGCLMTDEGAGRGKNLLLSQTVITDGDWHHIGFTWDGTNRILYVDDVIVAEDTQSGLPSSETGLYIGSGKALESSNFWSGMIDDVRIYNYAKKP